MNDENEQATAALTAFGTVNATLVTLLTELHNLAPYVRHVREGIEFDLPPAKRTLVSFLAAELESGESFRWTLRLAWGDGGFTVESAISGSNKRGEQETIKEFPIRRAVTVADLAAELVLAARQLVATSPTPDLARMRGRWTPRSA
jgi:hypothetical protein